MYGIQRKCEELILYVHHIHEKYSSLLNDPKKNDIYEFLFTQKKNEAKESANKAIKIHIETIERYKRLTKNSKIPSHCNNATDVPNDQQIKSIVEMLI